MIVVAIFHVHCGNLNQGGIPIKYGALSIYRFSIANVVGRVKLEVSHAIG